jgi:hypothetical protein
MFKFWFIFVSVPFQCWGNISAILYFCHLTQFVFHSLAKFDENTIPTRLHTYYLHVFLISIFCIMAMLHIENIDISENTDFFNDISKNDIWYKSPALPSSGRHTHISEFNIYDDIYRLNPTTTSTVNPSTICKNSCDKLWILQAYYMIKLFIFKLTSVIPHQFWMMVLGLTSRS